MASDSNRNFEFNSYANAMENKDYIPIAEAYAGRSVFITGGTGFLGKVLVEKLLRSCPDVKNIYLFMRPKRGRDASERLKTLISEPIFESLRKEHPKQLQKLIPIAGDITLPELGISQSDQDMLCEDVSVVFHSAATVSFNETLKLATTINMLGTRSVIQLCKRMQLLDALIHVSTVYINSGSSDDLQEIIYAPAHNPDDIINMIHTYPEAKIDLMTPGLIDKRPNTYTFTKSLAEYMILKEAAGLPVDIVRPSIVTASVKEPKPGWIDNYNAATGIVAPIAKGMLHSMHMGGNCIADLIPVDIVINCLITAGWRRITNKADKMHVYNICSNQRNPITWGEVTEKTVQIARKHPPEDALWYPYFIPNSKKSLIPITGTTLPLELMSLLNGSYTSMSKFKNIVQVYIASVDFFTSRQWQFKDHNVVHLLSLLSAEDREEFMFDVARINWQDYFVDYLLGVRMYLFKQKPESLPASHERMNRLYQQHQVTKVIAALMFLGFVRILFKANL